MTDARGVPKKGPSWATESDSDGGDGDGGGDGASAAAGSDSGGSSKKCSTRHAKEKCSWHNCWKQDKDNPKHGSHLKKFWHDKQQKKHFREQRTKAEAGRNARREAWTTIRWRRAFLGAIVEVLIFLLGIFANIAYTSRSDVDLMQLVMMAALMVMAKVAAYFVAPPKSAAAATKEKSKDK
jgi:hypothetical protein